MNQAHMARAGQAAGFPEGATGWVRGCAQAGPIGIVGPFVMGPTDIEGAALDALRAGAEAWPTVSLSAEDFSAWVQQRGITIEALQAHGSDLYLAAACSRGDRAAMA